MFFNTEDTKKSTENTEGSPVNNLRYHAYSISVSSVLFSVSSVLENGDGKNLGLFDKHGIDQQSYPSRPSFPFLPFVLKITGDPK